MRDEDSGWFQLRPEELFLLWTGLGHGEPPAALGLRHVGRTRAAKSRLAARTLAERGLGTLERPSRELSHLLGILAKGNLRLEMRVETPSRSFRAVSAVARHGCASVGIAGSEVRLGPVREPMLVATMLEALEPLEPGPGGPANARLTDFQEACEEGERHGEAAFLGRLEDAGVRGGEAGILLRLLTGRVRTGQFAAEIQGRSGRWSRTRSPINWVDTDQGRWVVRNREGWITATPVDGLRLRQMTQELVSQLVD